jgi:hypothetical protein
MKGLNKQGTKGALMKEYISIKAPNVYLRFMKAQEFSKNFSWIMLNNQNNGANLNTNILIY